MFFNCVAQVERRVQKTAKDKKATASEKSGLAKLLKALEEGKRVPIWLRLCLCTVCPPPRQALCRFLLEKVCSSAFLFAVSPPGCS